MASWVVVPCLLALRDEFNRINPNRDKGAEGTIGDSNHKSSSDHTPDEQSDVLRDHDPDSKNEVHAYDCDSTGPWPGTTFPSRVEAARLSEKAKWLSKTDKCRLKYIIFNRKIASQSTDFEWADYDGDDPHTNHAHFSARYETECENDTRPFGVYEEDEMSDADVKAIRSDIASVKSALTSLINAVPAKVLDEPTGNDAYAGRDLRLLAGDLHAFLDDYVGDAKGAATRPAKPGSLGYLLKELVTAEVGERLTEVTQRLAVVDQKLGLITEILDRLAPPAAK